MAFNLHNINILCLYDNDNSRFTFYKIIAGYGDILPKNELEYLVSIGIMLISCAIFAYTLNTITSVLSEINKS